MKLRYYSHAHLPSGFGRAALNNVLALDRAGAQLEVVTLGPRPADTPWPIPDHLSHPVESPDVVIVHTLPGDCHRVLEAEGLRRGAGPKLIAYTTWEALTAPQELVDPLYEHFDQVWTPSTPSAKALGATDHQRTIVVPHCYDEMAARLPFELLDRRNYRFYWIGSWSARKNPGGLIRAFAYAFGPGSNVELVLHCPGASVETFAATLAMCGLPQNELPAIHISTQFLNDATLALFHDESDCFVSAARGEAWNLPAFDAMLAGRHVITQYGLGSDDFLTNTSADLIDGWESPAQVDIAPKHSENGEVTFRRIGAQGLSSRSLWLEPNLTSLADAMLSAYQSRKRDLKIEYDVASRFGYAAVAQQMMDVMENLC